MISLWKFAFVRVRELIDRFPRGCYRICIYCWRKSCFVIMDMACNVIYTRFIAYYNKLLEVPDGDLQIFFRTHARFRSFAKSICNTKIRAINNVTFDKIFHGSKRENFFSICRLMILGCGRKSKSPDEMWWDYLSLQNIRRDI